MKRYLSRYFLFFLFLLSLLSLSITPDLCAQDGKRFLWKAELQGPVVYIFGSIHFLKKEHYPLHPLIEKAFEVSETLVVEAKIHDPKQLNTDLLKEKAFYQGKDSLKNHVSSETYELVKKEAERFGIPLELASRHKPWILAMTLASLEIMKLGYDPGYGVDYYFLKKGERQKRIQQLESVDYQINLLSSLSDSDQELALRMTLRDLKKSEPELDEIIRAWKAGDVQRMETVTMKNLYEEKNLYSLYETFLHERNKAMASKIEFYLKTNGTYLVVVGAAHLIGEKGIIEILKRKGYKISQL